MFIFFNFHNLRLLGLFCVFGPWKGGLGKEIAMDVWGSML